MNENSEFKPVKLPLKLPCVALDIYIYIYKERERERERERNCVCVRERERERETKIVRYCHKQIVLNISKNSICQSPSALKLVDKFTYLGSSVSSYENDINMWRAKAWTTIDRLSVIGKWYLSDRIKRNFFQVLYSYLHVHSASQRHNIKDRRRNEGRMIKTQEELRCRKEDTWRLLFKYIHLSLYCKGLKGLLKVACERMLETEHNLHILTPLLWPSRCVLFSWCWGQLHRGFFRGPPRSGVAFPTTSGLYCLEFCWQLHRGFSECPLGRVWPSLPHLVSNSLGVCWQLHRGFSECPLGRVWPSLPHLVSNSLGVCWQLLWDPNSTELNNNSTPTRSPTGSLKSNV